MTNPSPPALCANVAGPLQVWIDGAASNALEFVGWTQNGAQIEEIGYNAPIHSDELGGDQGPPVDYQYFGAQHRIGLEFSKYQPAVMAHLSLRYNPNTDSANIGSGMALKCSGSLFRLLLWAPNYVRNYVATFLLEPIDFGPVGTQYTRARLSMTANANNSGVIWNTTFT